MPRAATVCAVDRCPNVAVRRGRCAVHADRPYANNQERRERLGLNVPQRIKRHVRALAGHRCTCCGCDVPKGSGAVDHVLAGQRDSPLQLLCDECHARKTIAERAARAP